jgi:RNA polymerase primary sigma factor
MSQLLENCDDAAFASDYSSDSPVTVLTEDRRRADRGRAKSAGQSCGARGRTRRNSLRGRAERLLRTELGYIYHPCFDAPGAKQEILETLPQEGRTGRKPPEGADSYLAHLYEIPLLTREEEAHLFRKMNFLKFQADRLRRRIDPATARKKQLDSIEDLQRQALEVRNRIVESNLRLIFSLAKRYAAVGSAAFDEFMSEGHVTVLRAVEKFDFSRGVKFSTYATWSILNGFNALLKKEGTIQRRHIPDHVEGIAESLADHRVSLQEEKSLQELRQSVGDLLLNLNGRERRIIQARFGFDDHRAPTLRELGEEIGVSKERVRQLQERALRKLQTLAKRDTLGVSEC